MPLLRVLSRVCTMNDSRVIVLDSRAEKAVQGRGLGLLKTFLDCSLGDGRTERRGEAPVCKLKRSSICLAIFPIRG